MSTWTQVRLKNELKGFEEGVYDARCHTIDPIAYQVNSEYRKGVEIADQFIATLSKFRCQIPNPNHKAN